MWTLKDTLYFEYLIVLIFYVTEEKLFLFHDSCMCDLDKTKACMETYYSIRSTTPEFFNHRDLSSRSLKDTIENVYVSYFYLQEVGANEVPTILDDEITLI